MSSMSICSGWMEKKQEVIETCINFKVSNSIKFDIDPMLSALNDVILKIDPSEHVKPKEGQMAQKKVNKTFANF